MARLYRTVLALHLFAFLAIGAPEAVGAQDLAPPSAEEIEAAENAPLFGSEEALEVTIESDFHTLMREDRDPESEEERPGVLRWSAPDQATDSLEIQVRTRGKFRLARRNCEFPPLRLNLKKKSTEGTVFEGQDKLKLVSPCKLGQDYWEQYVLLEYMAYRTLNALTDLSFRVRLARVTYVDTSGEREPFTRTGFLIEDDDVLAMRHTARKVEWSAGQLDPRLLEPNHAILVDVYQYMIGNTDWSGAEMHNMELITTFENVPYTIPYDFDFSGLVNARYAIPDHTLPIDRVRERLFRGFCPDQMPRTQAQYDAVYALFLEKKDEIYETWRSLEGLDEGRLEDSLDYFDDFYEILENERLIEARMIRNCRRLAG